MAKQEEGSELNYRKRILAINKQAAEVENLIADRHIKGSELVLNARYSHGKMIANASALLKIQRENWETFDCSSAVEAARILLDTVLRELKPEEEEKDETT